MADQQRNRDRQPGQQIQVHPTWGFDAITNSRMPQKGPSVSGVLTLMVLLAVGFTLLALAGIALTGTIVGLCVVTPLFVVFSPVLVPAAITIGLAMAGFFTSGAFGLTALSSFSFSFWWVLNSFRQATGTMQEKADQVKGVGQKTIEVGQEIQSTFDEAGRTDNTGAAKADVGGKEAVNEGNEGRTDNTGAAKADDGGRNEGRTDNTGAAKADDGGNEAAAAKADVGGKEAVNEGNEGRTDNAGAAKADDGGKEAVNEGNEGNEGE